MKRPLRFCLPTTFYPPFNFGGDGIDAADYSNSPAGVTITLTANAAAALGGTGGDAAGDVLNTIETLIGSAFPDTLIGSAASNRLVSGAGNDVLRGGNGSDLLVASAGGSRSLFGDLPSSSSTDGGTAGTDTFRILAGTNLIRDYQAGEDVQLTSLTQPADPTALVQVFGASDPTLALRLVGSAHSTFVVVGSTADGAGAQAAAATLVQNDLLIDPTFTADGPWLA